METNKIARFCAQLAIIVHSNPPFLLRINALQILIQVSYFYPITAFFDVLEILEEKTSGIAHAIMGSLVTEESVLAVPAHAIAMVTLFLAVGFLVPQKTTSQICYQRTSCPPNAFNIYFGRASYIYFFDVATYSLDGGNPCNPNGLSWDGNSTFPCETGNFENNILISSNVL